MHVLLLMVGVLGTAAGLVTIGFGIPINAFSLGNTLIISGTIAVVGGLLLIGLSAVVRQLQQLGAVATVRPAQHPARQHEGAEQLASPTARPTPARPPAPPKAPDVAMPRPPEAGMPRQPEPHPVMDMPRPAAVAPATPASDDMVPLDWLRAKGREPGVPEEPVVDVHDEAPLSPRTPSRPPFSPPPQAVPPPEPKVWSPSRRNGAIDPKPAITPAPVPAPPPAPAPASQSEAVDRAPAEEPPPKEAATFDTVWEDPRSGRDRQPAARETRPEEPEVTAEPPRPGTREEQRAEKIGDLPPSERPVAILKSGVIDGMAYTLYADGAIEAELPQGTLKFASVDELRAHLEKNS